MRKKPMVREAGIIMTVMRGVNLEKTSAMCDKESFAFIALLMKNHLTFLVMLTKNHVRFAVILIPILWRI
jgi:hypothetical protein